MAKTKTALIAGATGMVGKKLLSLLLDCPDYGKVFVLSRRIVDIDHQKLQVIISDFNRLDFELPDEKIDDVFCCLGTTIKEAGSAVEFRKVDFDYCLQLAEACQKRGARHFLLISSIGANARSPLLFVRTKGELEEALKKLNYPALSIFRPSMLDGDREEKRPAEEIMLKVLRPLSIFTKLLMPALTPVKDREVAVAMLEGAKTPSQGVRLISSKEILNVTPSAS